MKTTKLVTAALALSVTLGLASSVKAYDYEEQSAYINVTYDDMLDEGKVLNFGEIADEASIHADGTITNQWNNGLEFTGNSYDLFVDYRAEGHLPLFKSGNHQARLITRIEGFGFLTDDNGDFFSDELIDIPELFISMR